MVLKQNDIFKFFPLTGQTGFFGTIQENSGRDKRDSGQLKIFSGRDKRDSGLFRIFRDWTFGIRDTKKAVPQDSTLY